MSAAEKPILIANTPDGDEIVRLRLQIIEMQGELDRQARTIATHQRWQRRNSEMR